MPPKIDLQKIETIVSCPDPVLRNLQITQTYSEINQALSGLLGKNNVSWCAYATWASKTAGKFIRLENVEAAIDEFLRDKDWAQEILAALPSAFNWFAQKIQIKHSFLLKILNETAQASAAEVGRGNLLVFQELAPLYGHFLQMISARPEQRQTELASFLQHLKQSQREGEDQQKLIQAYTAYQAAIFEKEPKAKAELIFFANVLVGYHEQIRLNPAINNSLNAPIEQVFKKKMLGGLEQLIETRVSPFWFQLFKPLLRNALKPVLEGMAKRWRMICTKLLMRIEVPDGHLDLSEDIPLMEYQPRRMFPTELEQIHNAELTAVLSQLDRNPSTTQGTAASDWGDLGERMNFIADFFRSAQQDEHLFWPPFNVQQTAQIRAGLIPPGKL